MRARYRSISSLTSSEFVIEPDTEPLATSSRKGIKSQTKAWNRDKEVEEASQRQAYVNLLDRHKYLESTHKRVVKERDASERKVDALRGLKRKNEELVETVRRMEAENKAGNEERKKMKVKTEALEEEVGKGLEERTRLKSELDRIRAELTKMVREQEQGRREVHSYHIPLRNNELCARPTFTRTLDDTAYCYIGAEPDVACMHMHVEVEGRLKQIRFRKRTRQMKVEKK